MSGTFRNVSKVKEIGKFWNKNQYFPFLSFRVTWKENKQYQQQQQQQQQLREQSFFMNHSFERMATSLLVATSTVEEGCNQFQ